MERLTYFDGGRWLVKIGDTEHSGPVPDRLAAYENTGLSPEETMELKWAREDGRNAPLKTTWETPETCPRCMEHLSREWSFCPECGRPTDWSENEPLTLDELREMDGEPVFIKLIGSDHPDDRGWALVDVGNKICKTVVGFKVFFLYYGKSWLAYRRRLEGGAT